VKEAELPDLDLLAAGGARQWVEFDVSVRRRWWWRTGGRRSPRMRLALAACSGDGREREAAVARLEVSRDPEALPLLLIRCVDWVEPVREAARRAVLSELDVSALRPVLALVALLRRRQVDDWMTTLFRKILPDLLDTALALGDRDRGTPPARTPARSPRDPLRAPR
jgi:hypothetical protein